MRSINHSVGFVGIGKMGKPMAQRLLAAGTDLYIFNRTKGKLKQLQQAGAKIAESAADLAEKTDVICLCLTDAAAVEHIVFAKQGIVEAATKQKLLVDFSSISPTDTINFSRRLQEQSGMRWVDAPVSGGVSGASQGKLAIMCGGDSDAIESLYPLFQQLGQGITHMGPTGSGQISKLCNQVIVSCNLAVIAEAINLARTAGVNAELLPRALQGGFADSLPLQVYGPRMAGVAQSEAMGEIYTMLKDVRNAIQYAKSLNTTLPMTFATEQIYQAVAGKGYLHADLESLIKQFDTNAEEK